jgi:hypothetical protein
MVIKKPQNPSNSSVESIDGCGTEVRTEKRLKSLRWNSETPGIVEVELRNTDGCGAGPCDGRRTLGCYGQSREE